MTSDRLIASLLASAILAVALAFVVRGLFGTITTAKADDQADGDVFSPPALEGFTLDGEEYRDGDGDKVKETLVRHYHNGNNDSVFSMTTNGRLWAWSLNTAGDPDNRQSHYVIRDSDCNGSFDERYTLDEEFTLPECTNKPQPVVRQTSG